MSYTANTHFYVEVEPISPEDYAARVRIRKARRDAKRAAREKAKTATEKASDSPEKHPEF